QEVAAELGHTKIAVNFVWALVAAFLVMFMQAGFALAETGFTRAKNASHTMAMNLMCYGLGILGFWVCGYALMMGGVGSVAALGGTAPLNSEFSVTAAGHTLGLFGAKGFFLGGDTYGVGALAGAWVLGPRLGKFTKDGRPNALPGHHMPMAILGVLILAFGWFGFNAGSTLAGTDLRVSVVAVNTMLASAAGAVSAMVV